MNTMFALLGLYLVIASLILSWSTLLWLLEGRKGTWTKQVLKDLLGFKNEPTTAWRHRACPGRRPTPGHHRRHRALPDHCRTRQPRRSLATL